jgi:SET domain-containing protein
MSLLPYQIQVKSSEVADGNGVFTLKDFKKGEIIEICPAIFVPIEQFKLIEQTKLFYYFFEYTNIEFAIVLGYGSIYNHSYLPNAQYRFNYRKRVMVVRAIRSIKMGEEIFFNYNFYADDKTPLESWFLEGVDKNHLG